MNFHFTRTTAAAVAIGTAVTLALWPLPQTVSGEASAGAPDSPTRSSERCAEMKTRKEKLSDEIRAQDQLLADDLRNLRKAPATSKVEMMEALLTRLVEQGSAINARKARMDGDMLQHMMHHMPMGKGSATSCPMMRGHRETDPTTAGTRPHTTPVEP